MFVFAGGVGFLGLSVGAAVFSNKLFVYLEPLAQNLKDDEILRLSTLWNGFWLFAVIFGLAYMSALFIVGLVFSNRLAGPLFRITQQLSSMIETGKLNKLEIRGTDFFEHVVVSLNEAIDKRDNNKNESKK